MSHEWSACVATWRRGWRCACAKPTLPSLPASRRTVWMPSWKRPCRPVTDSNSSTAVTSYPFFTCIVGNSHSVYSCVEECEFCGTSARHSGSPTGFAPLTTNTWEPDSSEAWCWSSLVSVCNCNSATVSESFFAHFNASHLRPTRLPSS